MFRPSAVESSPETPYAVCHCEPVGRRARKNGNVRVEVWAGSVFVGYKTEHDRFRFALVITGDWERARDWAVQQAEDAQPERYPTNVVEKATDLRDWLVAGKPPEFNVLAVNSWHESYKDAESASRRSFTIALPASPLGISQNRVIAKLYDIVEIPKYFLGG